MNEIELLKQAREMKHSIRIVVSDDSRKARAGLIALLRSFRFDVDEQLRFEVVGEASNGQEVIGLVEELNPDVVLIDARMPLIDGIEATRIVKAKHQDVKVVVLSMYAENRAPALKAGADMFLEKGVANANLGQTILKLFSIKV
jgi:DNA-binding NarL/FixJ family response regulator